MAGYIPITQTVYLPAVSQSPIQVVTGPVSINYVDRSQRANHYTTPSTLSYSEDEPTP